MRLRTGLAILPLVLVPLVACAPEDDDSGTTASDDTSSSAPAEETSDERSDRGGHGGHRPLAGVRRPTSCR